MTIAATEADIGRGVIYVPYHAHGDAGHRDCESGVITSIRHIGDHTMIFVRFGAKRHSESCAPDQLIWEFPR